MLKKALDELNCEYEIIDVSKRDDLVAQYQMTSAPTLVDSNDSVIMSGFEGKNRLRECITN